MGTTALSFIALNCNEGGYSRSSERTQEEPDMTQEQPATQPPVR
jgi:hypothetical protein